MSRFTSILRRTFGVVKEHVGTDNFGNKYYTYPSRRHGQVGRVTRHRRLMEAANPAEFEYSCSIPSEWDAWIRGRRKHPPTIEELLKNELYRENIKIKAEEVEERDKALQSKEYKEGLVASPVQAQIKGHASATLFGQSEVSEEPVSTANTFQPGSWASPGTKK